MFPRTVLADWSFYNADSGFYHLGEALDKNYRSETLSRSESEFQVQTSVYNLSKLQVKP